MEQRPNILLITTDQHSAEALGHLGCNDVKTPGMDRLAARESALQNPIAQIPSAVRRVRVGLPDATHPENGVVANGANMVPSMPDLGQWLNKNGYNAYYSGKWHIPGRDVAQSFHHICPDPRNTAETGDIDSTRSTIGFLQNYQEKDPFFLSVGLLNPHDICSFVLTHTMHDGKMPFPELDDLPPLPPNFETDMAEPEKNHKLSESETGRSRRRIGYEKVGGETLPVLYLDLLSLH